MACGSLILDQKPSRLMMREGRNEVTPFLGFRGLVLFQKAKLYMKRINTRLIYVKSLLSLKLLIQIGVKIWENIQVKSCLSFTSSKVYLLPYNETMLLLTRTEIIMFRGTAVDWLNLFYRKRNICDDIFCNNLSPLWCL